MQHHLPPPPPFPFPFGLTTQATFGPSNKLVTFTDAVLTVSCFSYTGGWNQSKHVFLIVKAPFYCSGERMHCLETSGNKNNLRTIWGWNRQKIKNNSGSAESHCGTKDVILINQIQFVQCFYRMCVLKISSSWLFCTAANVLCSSCRDAIGF